MKMGNVTVRWQVLLFAFLLLRLASCSVVADRKRVEIIQERGVLKPRQAQFIVDPCPEFFGDAPAFCSDSKCGGDTVQKGICDGKRLNGLQNRWCQQQGGCGVHCKCQPDRGRTGPSKVGQWIGIFCPESYGDPTKKCDQCGGDAYFKGYCDDILVSGAQGPGCPKGGCGIICKYDDTPGPDPTLQPIPSTEWLTGSGTGFPTALAIAKPTGVDSETVILVSTGPAPGESGSLTYISGPLPEPTTFPPPAATTTGGYIFSEDSEPSQ